jgi:hypothetical protein
VDQVVYLFLGVAVRLDDSTILLCCRNIHDTKDSSLPGYRNTPETNTSFLVSAQARSGADDPDEDNRDGDDTEEKSGGETKPEPSDPVSEADGPASADQKPHLGKEDIFARTFGHFDLFVRDTPVIFSSAKEKELLALLIDLRGGTLSANEAISYLWPDENLNDRLSNRYRKVAMKLKNTLAKYGIEHILINNHGIRSIDVSAITCDCYEMLAGNEKYNRSFSNSYLPDYSWGEGTLARLWNYTRSDA